MQSAPIPNNEAERLEALRRYKLLDTLPEEVYDDIVRIASEVCGTPMAMLSLIDENRQWVKAKSGIELIESSRDISFCAHAVVDPNNPFVVEDARFDERFHDNPFTTGDSKIVFYAGVPVVDPDGFALGTICVLDSRPRELTDQKMEALKALAKWVQTNFELRRKQQELEQAQEQLARYEKAFGIIEATASNISSNEQRPEQIALLNQLLQVARQR